MDKAIEKLERLATCMHQRDIKKFEGEIDGANIHMRRGDTMHRAALATTVEPPVATPQATQATPGAVVAPMAGVFYRTSTPDAEPCVAIGQTVHKGDTLCIIESMKMMNVIAASHVGKVTAVHAANAQAVTEGQSLLVLSSE